MIKRPFRKNWPSLQSFGHPFVSSPIGMARSSKQTNISRQYPAGIKAVFQYCLLPLLAFFLTAAPLKSFSQSVGVFTPTEDNCSKIQPDHPLSSAQFSYHLPFESNPVDSEMEISEEEDDKFITDAFTCQDIVKYSSAELFYTAFIRNRLSQISSAIGNRPKVPFFILYHSWKRHLA
ncbi:hypothetical protein ACFSQD_13820 [Flavihumibacter stibioxidans]|uniref:Uncharacterized protein n=1 Tax=Flavihumibacter stibioxidans TaxID=1834163 RepID=A0ABR7M8Q3_9BACT|nr:hypothetical protein [Flavihumibacter stibioxidans]MBC6491321.1 hypothetical protein [Flavihumibacter stibioxidans]